MSKRRLICVGLVGLATALVGITFLQYNRAEADVLGGPLPAPSLPPDDVQLTPVAKLGKLMLYDSSLSNPPGYSCATCHVPETGFTGPSSQINTFSGPQPGVVPGRFSNRKPQSYLYASFCPVGPYYDPGLKTWLGGDFWNGRVPDLATQALQPPLNPNEMANTPDGPYPPLNGGYSPLLVQKLANRPYTPLFKEVYGQDAFQVFSLKRIYELFGEAIAAYESSGEVCAFSSKYDASKYGTPPKSLYTLTDSEERGRQLFFGQAQCSACHSSAAVPGIQATTQGKDTFTMYCYANIGVPKNIDNPYYQQTDKESNPHGYNSRGTNYIDYGLGANPNPARDGTRFYEKVPGDIPQFRGLFKTPSMRSVDKRPSPEFVKAYMHNGVFKSLKDVVHFYNKRNIAADTNGKEIAFDLRKGPPPGYTPLFPPPEVLDNVQNVTGVPPSQATSAT
ncbi:MAG TPA: cytochrome c peroxidase, partial [Chthoniobacterales bacterium]|nr:cytochrome c peroxidase [Chthoniobacterales bacterium]